jgi:hypothetical protein
MHNNTSVSPVKDKVLLLSQRRVADLVAFCLAYEFEDTVMDVADGTRIDVSDRAPADRSRKMYKAARAIMRSAALAQRFTPAPPSQIVLDRDYELFFPMFSSVYEVYALSVLKNWRERSRKACCFITEAWSGLLPDYLIEQLGAFDHIFVGSTNAVADIERISGRPCSYLPLAVDVLRFAPSSPNRARPFAVCNIGRRSAVTHKALLEGAERLDGIYYYDTVAASGSDRKDRTFRVDNASEHRLMLATLLKNARYFIAHRSYVNRPEFTVGRDELSARFYEGAASGTVMIGEAPRGQTFDAQFDWPDAVIHMPFDAPDIVERLLELDRDTARLAAIRRNGVREAARRHDWLHRIRTVFETLDVEETEAMRQRAQRLEGLVASSMAS